MLMCYNVTLLDYGRLPAQYCACTSAHGAYTVPGVFCACGDLYSSCARLLEVYIHRLRAASKPTLQCNILDGSPIAGTVKITKALPQSQDGNGKRAVCGLLPAIANDIYSVRYAPDCATLYVLLCYSCMGMHACTIYRSEGVS